MKKSNIDTASVVNKFLKTNTQKTENTQSTESTDNTQSTHFTPKRKYRYNLSLDADLDAFLHKMAWLKRTSMTQYLNDLIRREKEEYLTKGGSLEGWETDV